MSPDSTYLGSFIFDNGPWVVLNRFTLVENLDVVVRFGDPLFFFFFFFWWRGGGGLSNPPKHFSYPVRRAEWVRLP